MKINRLNFFAIGAVLMAGACANPAKDAPAADVQEPVAETAPAEAPAPAAEAVAYTLAEGTKVDWVGSKVTGSHDGGFAKVSGTVSVVGGTPEGSSVDVVIDATSLWSDSERLTGHLKSADFFEVETYPEARFTSTSVEKAADGAYTMAGDLTMKGVTKRISFPATVTVSPEQVTANAEFSIKRFDWNIVFAGKADDLIRDDVLIKLALVATPAAAAPAADAPAEAAPNTGV